MVHLDTTGTLSLTQWDWPRLLPAGLHLHLICCCLFSWEKGREASLPPSVWKTGRGTDNVTLIKIRITQQTWKVALRNLGSTCTPGSALVVVPFFSKRSTNQANQTRRAASRDQEHTQLLVKADVYLGLMKFLDHFRTLQDDGKFAFSIVDMPNRVGWLSTVYNWPNNTHARARTVGCSAAHSDAG